MTIKDIYFKVLDDGFVALKDYMGSDEDIERSARVSYGKGTRKVSDTRNLLRYLLRNKHTSPFEFPQLSFHVRAPIYVYRQWHRHRTWCLSGDTQLQFDLPGGIRRRGNQLYTLSIKDVFDKFNANSHRKNRIQNMMLRCVDENNLEIKHTNIVDIWESGYKDVYEITLSNGSSIKTSAFHKFFTNDGWKRLCDFSNLSTNTCTWDDIKIAGICRLPECIIPSVLNEIDEAKEKWKPVLDWENYYEVSSQGRVRRIVGGRGSRSFGRCKKVTINNNRAVVSLNKPGKQEVCHISRLMATSFLGKPKENKNFACHKDGNSLNNIIENIYWGSPQDNSNDSKNHGSYLVNKCDFLSIVNIKHAGRELVYDIEVADPHHNFSANGIIVHNSYNEYSARYSVMIDSMEKTPQDKWRLQSGTNKQGSDGFLQIEGGRSLSEKEESFQTLCKEIYDERLDAGVAREQARKDMPVSNYSEMYATVNLHNLLHFMNLRCDSHAQLEIRQYANIIAGIVKELFPLTFEAWYDYSFQSSNFTRLDKEFLNGLIDVCSKNRHISPDGLIAFKDTEEEKNISNSVGLSKRELNEFWSKIDVPNVQEFDLDYSNLYNIQSQDE